MSRTTWCFAAIAAALLPAWADHGPLNRPDDQYRFVWGCRDSHVPAFASNGFNTVISNPYLGWKLLKGESPERMDKTIAKLRSRLDACQSLGVGFIRSFSYGYDKDSIAAYPRIDRDGSADLKNVDAANPAYRAAVRRAVAEEVKRTGSHPALIGTLVESETRGFVRPSFTPEMAEAYRAYSGRDVPDLTNGRNPVPWRKIPGFPKDGVVPDDYPLLDFYRWQWREGDGWAGYFDMVAETFAANCDHPVMSMFDPALRCLSQWGNNGRRLTHINHWTYVYPEPCRIGYHIEQLQAAARGIPGQGVLAMIQAISYRSVIAPMQEHPGGEPPWTKEVPAARYITTPPDLVQEAMWHVFARKVDGIGFHGWNALYDDGNRGSTDHYALSNPETARRIGRVFSEVGVPLGPLFRAVPDREPVVAVLESCAAQVLGGRITYDVHDYFAGCMFVANAANLSPYVIYEDEVKASGIPPSVKVVIVPKCDVLTRTTYERLAEFQRRGGRIVADDRLLPALKADAKYVPLQEEEKNTLGDFDDGVVRKASDAEVRDRAVWRSAKNLRDAVGLAPYADSTQPQILVRARSYGTADYVFAVNARRTLGDYVGPWRRVLEKGVPNAGEVTVARKAGAVYDLVRNCPVPFSSGDGGTRIPVSYDTNDGRVFMVVDAPLGGLSYEVDGTRLTVESPDRAAMIPIRVDVPGEKPRYAVVRDGRWSHDFGSEPKDPVVTNLADGKAASRRGWWCPF